MTSPQPVFCKCKFPKVASKNGENCRLCSIVSAQLQEELVRAGVLPDDYDFEGHRDLAEMKAGDVTITYADSTALEQDYGFNPRIGIREGLCSFAEWHKEYYG